MPEAGMRTADRAASNRLRKEVFMGKNTGEKKKGALKRGYGMNEVPRAGELGAFGLQHALLILFQTLPAPLLIAGGLGLGPVETSILIASALFVSGICTFVQSFGVGPL